MLPHRFIRGRSTRIVDRLNEINSQAKHNWQDLRNRILNSEQILEQYVYEFISLNVSPEEREIIRESIVKYNLIYSHPYHLVYPSSLPFYVSVNVFFLVVTFVLYLKGGLFFLFFLCLLSFLRLLLDWFLNIISESSNGHHNFKVRKGLKIGFSLFIVSEVMFFFGFFWAFFYSGLSPSIWIGATWPPLGISPIYPYSIPLLNTFYLLNSGLAITAVHNFVISVAPSGWGDAPVRMEWTLIMFFYTLHLASIFLLYQFYEFLNSAFSINDGIYGSCFFMITGLHGFHVFIGALFILFCFLRYRFFPKHTSTAKAIVDDYRDDNHQTFFIWIFRIHESVGLVCAIWYWHFVDVVWLFVFAFVYCWAYSGVS